ncbi:MAG: glycerophosphodiester phosphodiesterase [Aeromonas sp.]
MQIIAHRGASGQAPENTLKAIQLALNQGARAVEIDVQCADGELWVFHDRRLERTSNGAGVLSAQSRHYLAGLDAGDGESIPTLWQVVCLLAQAPYPIELHVELKGADTAAPVAALLSQAEATLNFSPAQWRVSSFNHLTLREFAMQRPDICLGALTASLPLDLARFASDLGAGSVNCDVDFISPQLVTDAHARGLQVLVYTVDAPEDGRWLQAMGVDGIFSNYPERFSQL